MKGLISGDRKPRARLAQTVSDFRNRSIVYPFEVFEMALFAFTMVQHALSTTIWGLIVVCARSISRRQPR